jgi:glycosyltransferase involved in cell wall biosynthesis
VNRVTVVVPTYNRAQFIEETVKSILAQSLPPLEVIIVDDGSTDHTADVCARFHEPVRYIRRQNEGAAAARNAGIRAATGDWIAFCDSDDLWKPRKLELQMAALAVTGAGWSFTAFGVIDPGGRPLHAQKSGFSQAFEVLAENRVPPTEHFAQWLDLKQIISASETITIYHGDAFGMLFLGNVVLTSTSVFSRGVLDRAGLFDQAFWRAEDTEFFHRISAHSDVAIVMESLVDYRVGHPSIMTGDSAPFIEYTLRSIQEASLRRPKLTTAERTAFMEGRRQLRMRLAYSRLSSLDRGGARKALSEAWGQDRIFSVRSAAIMIASFLPNAILRGLHHAKQTIRRQIK